MEVDASADAAPIPGRLQLINNEIDASTGTIRVRAVFDNPAVASSPASSPASGWARQKRKSA